MSFVQEQNHRLAIVAAEGAKQTALQAARLAFNGTPAAYPTYAAAVLAADVAAMRAIIASAAAQGLGDVGRQGLYWATGSWT
jgi:hypothetical protein